MLKTLESANRNVSIFLNKTKGIETKKRYNQIKTFLNEMAKDVSKKVDSSINVEKWVKDELKSLKTIFSKQNGYDKLDFPSARQVINASTFTPYAENKVYDSYLENITEQFFNTWDSAVRTGYMTGMPTKDVVKTVLGSVAKDAQVAKSGTIDTLRNSLMANTRTALQSFAVETQCNFYKKNASVFQKYQWLSTLDRRTCLTCGTLDAKIYNSLSEIKDRPPLHLNCRCVILPYFEGLDEIDNKRASENGYWEGVSYEDWLREQPENVQKDVLGKSRFLLYKAGEDIGSFVSNNKIIPIDNLYSKIGEDSLENQGFEYKPTIDKERFNKLKEDFKLGLNIDIDEKLADMDINSVSDFCHGIEDILKEYPDIPVNSVNLMPKNMMKGKNAGIAYSGGNKIFLDEKYFCNYEALKEKIKTDENSHYFVKGLTVRGLAYHEMGHNLYYSYLVKQGNNHIQAFSLMTNEETSKDFVKKIFKSYKHEKDLYDSVYDISYYSTTLWSEIMAESFADVIINKNNAQELSTHIVNFLLKEV